MDFHVAAAALQHFEAVGVVEFFAYWAEHLFLAFFVALAAEAEIARPFVGVFWSGYYAFAVFMFALYAKLTLEGDLLVFIFVIL